MYGWFRSFTLGAVLVAALSSPLAALALPSYTNLFVFGDSLADSGNNALVLDGLAGPGVLRTSTPTDPAKPLIPDYPYASNRYSNGPVWVEQLAAELGLGALPSLAGGTNYAFGGARIGPAGSTFPYSLTDQVGSYLATTGGLASATALYVVEGGGNDARDIIYAAATGGDFEAMIGQYALGVANIITQLKNAGAQEILLWNVPDVSKIPYLQWATGGNPLALGQASALVAAMNSALDFALDRLPEPWLNGLHLFDAYSAFNDVFDNPLNYGLDDVHTVCSAQAACLADADGVFFWDGIHPTTAGHAILARLSAAELPEPSSIFLLAAALLVLVFAHRRRVRFVTERN